MADKKGSKIDTGILLDVSKDDKPMFTSEDLDLKPEAKFRHDEAVELKEEINRLWQVVHQKGLDVGLPRIILYDINAIMIAVNKMNSVWAGDDVRKKEREEDEDVTKLLNKGDEVLAFHRVREQVLQLREQRIRMSTFLSVLIDKFEVLSRRLQSDNIDGMVK